MNKETLAELAHQAMERVNSLCIVKYASPMMGILRPAAEYLARFEEKDLKSMLALFVEMGDELEKGMSHKDIHHANVHG